MRPRTIAQLALLAIGLIVWGYGARADDNRLRWIGIGCFGAAFLLRVLRKKLSSEGDNAAS
jgi:hypothetical protein